MTLIPSTNSKWPTSQWVIITISAGFVALDTFYLVNMNKGAEMAFLILKVAAPIATSRGTHELAAAI